MTADPRVCAVVITYNRRAELLHTLGCLTALPERPRVVVVDSGSSDGTAEAVCREFPTVEVSAQPVNLGAVGRNVGVGMTSTPYVAFCDDDTWYDAGALSHACDVLDAHPSVAVLTGRILVEPGARDDPINVELREAPIASPADLPGFPLVSFLAGASVVRRSAFLAVGGFRPELFLGGEEELLAADLMAAGWALRHDPSVVVHHRPSRARDAHRYRRQGIRNALWFWWLRRPVISAVRRTAHMARSAPHDRVTLLGFLDAIRGWRMVARGRRVVPPHVEAAYRAVDRRQMTSPARRYVS